MDRMPPAAAQDAWPAADEVARVFLALDLPDEVRRALARVQQELRRAAVRVGWVAPENLHLTLVFLGDVFGTTLRALEASLRRSAEAASPLRLELQGVGAFGSPGHPRVLWAGIPAPPEELFALQRSCADVVRAAGVVLEARPFAAHVTLGRVRPGAAAGAAALTSLLQCHINTPFGCAPVRTLRLVRSRLEARGPVYQTLQEWPLGPRPGGTDHSISDAS